MGITYPIIPFPNAEFLHFFHRFIVHLRNFKHRANCNNIHVDLFSQS